MAAIASVSLVERLVPYEPAWNQSRRDVARDLAHALVNEGIAFGAASLTPMIVCGHGAWPLALPRAAQLALAIVIADLGVTLTHVASHRVALLWRLHAVHHSVGRMYGLNGLVKHPLHLVIELVVGTAPLALLGMPPDVAGVLGYAVALQLLLQHSNIDLRSARWCTRGPSRRRIVTIIWRRRPTET